MIKKKYKKKASRINTLSHQIFSIPEPNEEEMDKEMIEKQSAIKNIYSKEECADCWAKFYCSGGCNANNMQYNNTIFKPHKLSCALEQKRLECAIMIKAALADE